MTNTPRVWCVCLPCCADNVARCKQCPKCKQRRAQMRADDRLLTALRKSVAIRKVR
jgi:hypothetical protein